MMEHPGTRSMNLTENLCHEYAVQVARMMPPDFVVNVTIRDDGKPVGVFAGYIDRVLLSAFEQLKTFVLVPLPHRFDIVVTHEGRGAINHYQAVKAVTVGALATEQDGYLMVRYHRRRPHRQRDLQGDAAPPQEVWDPPNTGG